MSEKNGTKGAVLETLSVKGMDKCLSINLFLAEDVKLSFSGC